MSIRANLTALFLTTLSAAACGRPETAAGKPAPSVGVVTDVGEIQVEFKALSIPTRMAAGSETQIRFEAKNTGTTTWPAAGAFPLHFGYHWEAPAGGDRWETIVWDDSNRIGLPSDTRPGQSIVLTMPVRAVSRHCTGCRLLVVPVLEMKAWSDTARLTAPIDVF